jgi:hypothetical protein
MSTDDSIKNDKRIKHGECRGRYSGKSDTTEYSTWHGMIQRCTNPNSPRYDRYGGRGISVCSRWRESFQNFLDDMGRKPSQSHSIDRINNDGNYEPSNCRWATQAEQMRNASSANLLTHNGETLCLTDWSIKTGISISGLRHRIALGWTVEEILTTTKTPRGHHLARLLTYKNETHSVAEWARKLGISRLTLSDRLRRGWTVETALATPVKQ